MGNSPLIFVSPVPTLLFITTATTNLEAAETLASTRVTGSASARNLKYDIVLKAIHSLLAYVQILADAAPDEATAISIINASGFGLRSTGSRSKAPLAAKNGTVSGTVSLVAKAAAVRAAYNWHHSTDGITWSEMTTTLQAKTIVSGLTPGTTIFFQCRIITKLGTGNWSSPESIVVQ